MILRNGIGDLKVGDIVNIIPPKTWDDYDEAFGIAQGNWESAMVNNPYTIEEVIDDIADESGVIKWSGYKLKEEPKESGFKYIWPHWGLELINPSPEITDLL